MQCVAQSAEARNAAAEENEVGNLTFCCILRVLPISFILHLTSCILRVSPILRHSLQVYLLFCILRVSLISCRIDQSLQVYLLLLQIQPPRIALSVRPCHSDIISLPLINRSVSGESGKPKAWVELGWGDYGPSYLIIYTVCNFTQSVYFYTLCVIFVANLRTFECKISRPQNM